VSWTTWDPAPTVLVGAGLAIELLVRGFHRLRRRSRRDHASWSRAALFALAVTVGTLPLVSPLDEAGDNYLLSAHMLQHVLIGDAGPALALVALRGPLLFFLLPRTLVCRLAHVHLLRRMLTLLLRPRVSLAMWMTVTGVWHIPAAYDYALTNQTVHDLEHLSFITVGLLAWAQLVDPARRNSPPQRLRCMVAMATFALALGSILIATSPQYLSYARVTTHLFGIAPSLDQHLAGAVMVGEQLGALAICACFLLGGGATRRLGLSPPLRAEDSRQNLPMVVLPVQATQARAVQGFFVG
jgi:cytochrome c oxidase assembly factor CtaG